MSAKHEFDIATRKVAAKYAAKRAATIFEFVVFCFKGVQGRTCEISEDRYVYVPTKKTVKDERLSLKMLLAKCQKQASIQTPITKISIYDEYGFNNAKFNSGFPSCSEAELITVLDRLCELGQIRKHENQIYEWVDNYHGRDFYPST